MTNSVVATMSNNIPHSQFNAESFSMHEEILLIDSKGNNNGPMPTSEELHNYLLGGSNIIKKK
jgi:hypothetical protein